MLLEQEHADTDRPSISWTTWLEGIGLPRLKHGGMLRFSHHDALMQAAIDGQGVALAISPLRWRHITRKRLVAPFEKRIASPGAYHLIASRHAVGRADVAVFADWLLRNAARENDAASSPAVRPVSRSRPCRTLQHDSMHATCRCFLAALLAAPFAARCGSRHSSATHPARATGATPSSGVLHIEAINGDALV